MICLVDMFIYVGDEVVWVFEKLSLGLERALPLGKQAAFHRDLARNSVG